MLIPGHENYDYVYNFETKIETIKNLHTNKYIKFDKLTTREFGEPFTFYLICLDGCMVDRAQLRGLCVVENPFLITHPFRITTLIKINKNNEDDTIENLKWVLTPFVKDN